MTKNLRYKEGILINVSTLYTHTTGSGPTIVMIHGFLGSMQYFKKLRKLISDDARVITIDLLGSGKSPKPVTPITYELQIEALHETLKNERAFTIVGHSMGAVLAARYATMYPHQVKKLLLFNPPLFATASQAKESIESTSLRYRAALAHPRSRVLWKTLKTVPRMPQKIAYPLNFGDMLRTHHLAREGGYQNIILAAEFVSDIERLTQPTLIIRGLRDRYVYAATAANLAAPENITITTVQTGHHTIITKPKLAASFIRSHLLQ